MTIAPSCSKCKSTLCYQDREFMVCPECAYEWSLTEETSVVQDNKIKDANGNILNEGDFVTVIKDLKVKGSSMVIKVGTKIKINRITDNDHDIDCKIDGFGQMGLKSEFVKKVN